MSDIVEDDEYDGLIISFMDESQLVDMLASIDMRARRAGGRWIERQDSIPCIDISCVGVDAMLDYFEVAAAGAIYKEAFEHV